MLRVAADAGPLDAGRKKCAPAIGAPCPQAVHWRYACSLSKVNCYGCPVKAWLTT